MSSHTFNWHEEPEDSFLRWAMTEFLGDPSKRGDNEFFDRMSRATDRFTNVELKVTVSGIEIDAGSFMKRLDEAVDHSIALGVVEKVNEMPRVTELEDMLSDLKGAIRREILKVGLTYGIDFTEDD